LEEIGEFPFLVPLDHLLLEFLVVLHLKARGQPLLRRLVKGRVVTGVSCELEVALNWVVPPHHLEGASSPIRKLTPVGGRPQEEVACYVGIRLVFVSLPLMSGLSNQERSVVHLAN